VKKNACINGKAEIVGPEESTELDSLLSLHLHSAWSWRPIQSNSWAEAERTTGNQDLV